MLALHVIVLSLEMDHAFTLLVKPQLDKSVNNTHYIYLQTSAIYYVLFFCLLMSLSYLIICLTDQIIDNFTCKPGRSLPVFLSVYGIDFQLDQNV